MLDKISSYVFLGFGAVARCLYPMLKKYFNLNPKQCVIIDNYIDEGDKVRLSQDGAVYFEYTIRADNLSEILIAHAKRDSLVIDLTVNVDTASLVTKCQELGLQYINAAVEEWNPYHELDKRPPQSRTLYYRQSQIQKIKSSKGGPTMLLDHGANPGTVSHLTKKALLDIAKEVLRGDFDNKLKVEVQKLVDRLDFPALSQALGVKVIHIAERDSQVTKVARRHGEFLNTWSVHGFYEEGVAPAEMGWGTHEPSLPKSAFEHSTGEKNQICLAQTGFKTRVRSWVPSGPILGMVIRHGEAYTISKYLTVRDGNRVAYRPTVHYAYSPCDAAIASLWDLESRGLSLDQMTSTRVLSGNDIESGFDELGVLLMGHVLGAWWTGIKLDVDEAKKIVEGQNATLVQVAGSLAAGIAWINENPNRGVVYPEDLDHDRLLEIARPFLGHISSQQSSWTPLIDRFDRSNFNLFNSETKFDEKETWAFSNFISY